MIDDDPRGVRAARDAEREAGEDDPLGQNARMPEAGLVAADDDGQVRRQAKLAAQREAKVSRLAGCLTRGEGGGDEARPCRAGRGEGDAATCGRGDGRRVWRARWAGG
ncbi:MAG: hypothetical protein MUE97_06810 [Phycisphaerales bacterium]|jgi:hypothetical protein|nr:hypothetical protein [Phycisphaerales bacterium]